MDANKLNIESEKVIEFVSAFVPELNKYPHPLSKEQAARLISKYGYENSLNYLSRLANYKVGLKKYSSVYLTVNSWLSEDLSKGKIQAPKAEIKPQSEHRKTAFQPWTSDEYHEAEELFLCDYSEGAEIYTKDGIYKVVRGRLESNFEAHPIRALELIKKYFVSYLFRARELREQKKLAENFSAENENLSAIISELKKKIVIK